MVSNAQIKRKEIYKAQQELIKVYGNLKKAQNDMLKGLNECALAECCHYNKLQKGAIALRMKASVKHYFRVYGQKILLEERIDELTNWLASNTSDEKRRFEV